MDWYYFVIIVSLAIRLIWVEIDRHSVNFYLQRLYHINHAITEQYCTSEKVFSQELLNKLIRLSHPDKHKGSVMSKEVTQELLKLRAKRNE